MMSKWILARLGAYRRAIGDRLPPPMAAPETPQLRRMRMTLIVELAMIAVLTAAWPLIAATCLCPVGALVWIALALSILNVGVRWLTAKIRADNAWAAREPDE